MTNLSQWSRRDKFRQIFLVNFSALEGAGEGRLFPIESYQSLFLQRNGIWPSNNSSYKNVGIYRQFNIQVSLVDLESGLICLCGFKLRLHVELAGKVTCFSYATWKIASKLTYGSESSKPGWFIEQDLFNLEIVSRTFRQATNHFPILRPTHCDNIPAKLKLNFAAIANAFKRHVDILYDLPYKHSESLASFLVKYFHISVSSEETSLSSDYCDHANTLFYFFNN